MAIRLLSAALCVWFVTSIHAADNRATSITSSSVVPNSQSLISNGLAAGGIYGGLFSASAPPVVRPVAFRVNNGALLPAEMPQSTETNRWLEQIPTPTTVPWTRAHDQHPTTGFIDFNTYWDTRDMAVTTINLLANLPGDFQFFQFINFDSALGRGSHDWTDFYTELHLRHTLWSSNPYLSHLDWALQYADGNGPHGVLRGGIRWRLQNTPGRIGDWFSERLKLKYFLTFYFFETDSTGWQMEHAYRRDFFDGRMYIGGFCDHNIDNHSRNSTWVTEHQFGVKLASSLYAVAEYRYKSFMPAGSRDGLGIGLEYVMRFK